MVTDPLTASKKLTKCYYVKDKFSGNAYEEIKRLPQPISLFSAIGDEANIIKDVLKVDPCLKDITIGENNILLNQK